MSIYIYVYIKMNRIYKIIITNLEVEKHYYKHVLYTCSKSQKFANQRLHILLQYIVCKV